MAVPRGRAPTAASRCPLCSPGAGTHDGQQSPSQPDLGNERLPRSQKLFMAKGSLPSNISGDKRLARWHIFSKPGRHVSPAQGASHTDPHTNPCRVIIPVLEAKTEASGVKLSPRGWAPAPFTEPPPCWLHWAFLLLFPTSSRKPEHLPSQDACPTSPCRDSQGVAPWPRDPSSPYSLVIR